MAADALAIVQTPPCELAGVNVIVLEGACEVQVPPLIITPSALAMPPEM
jgi:hypothetical protein